MWTPALLLPHRPYLRHWLTLTLWRKLTRRTAGVRCSCPGAHPACPRARSKTLGSANVVPPRPLFTPSRLIDRGEPSGPLLYSLWASWPLFTPSRLIDRPGDAWGEPSGPLLLARGQPAPDCLCKITVGQPSPLLFISASSNHCISDHSQPVNQNFSSLHCQAFL